MECRVREAARGEDGVEEEAVVGEAGAPGFEGLDCGRGEGEGLGGEVEEGEVGRGGGRWWRAIGVCVLQIIVSTYKISAINGDITISMVMILWSKLGFEGREWKWKAK